MSVVGHLQVRHRRLCQKHAAPETGAPQDFFRGDAGGEHAGARVKACLGGIGFARSFLASSSQYQFDSVSAVETVAVPAGRRTSHESSNERLYRPTRQPGEGDLPAASRIGFLVVTAAPIRNTAETDHDPALTIGRRGAKAVGMGTT